MQKGEKFSTILISSEGDKFEPKLISYEWRGDSPYVAFSTELLALIEHQDGRPYIDVEGRMHIGQYVLFPTDRVIGYDGVDGERHTSYIYKRMKVE